MRNQFGYALTLAAGLFVGSLVLSGCGGGTTPTHDPKAFNRDFTAVIERINSNRGGQRESAILNLQRAWDAGELQDALSEMEFKELRLKLAAKAKGDPSRDVRKVAKNLLKTMAGKGEEGAEEAPAEEG